MSTKASHPDIKYLSYGPIEMKEKHHNISWSQYSSFRAIFAELNILFVWVSREKVWRSLKGPLTSRKALVKDKPPHLDQPSSSPGSWGGGEGGATPFWVDLLKIRRMSCCLLEIQDRGWQGLQGSQGTRGRAQRQVVKVKVIIKVRIRVRVCLWSTSANFLNPPADSVSIRLHTWIATKLTSTVEVPPSPSVWTNMPFMVEV